MRQTIIMNIIALAMYGTSEALLDAGFVDIGYDNYKEERKDATGTHILYSGLVPAISSLFSFECRTIQTIVHCKPFKIGTLLLRLA